MSARAKTPPRIDPWEAIAATSEAADQSVQAAVIARDSALAAHKADMSAAKTAARLGEQLERAKPPAPDPRDAPLARIAGIEQTAWARISPRHRNRFKELVVLDERVAELDQRQSVIFHEINAMREQRASAEQRFAAALAGWYSNNQQDERPTSDASQLDARLADLQGEHDALDELRGIVLQEKTQFVERNRKRLARTAASAVQKARLDYERSIGELEQTRAALADARGVELWTRAFPHEALGVTPPVSALCGGLKRLTNKWFGAINSPLDAAPMFGLLRDDAAFIAEMISPELRAAIAGVKPELVRGDQAFWADSPEAKAREQREKEREIEQQTIAFGRRPARYSG